MAETDENANPPVASPPSPLRRARLVRGLSQEVVARAVGIDRMKLSRAERGVLALSPTELKRLATIYAADCSELTA